MATQPSNEELRLLVKVARFYYEDGLNQDAITARLGLSRSKVSRLMAQARETGVVQISVVAPDDLFQEFRSRNSDATSEGRRRLDVEIGLRPPETEVAR